MLNNPGFSSGILLAKYQGEMVGFFLYMANEEILINKVIGLDYDKSQQTYAYFALLYKLGHLQSLLILNF
jgi:hypothetical protein